MRAAAIAGLLVAAVFAVYGQTLEHEFVNYDDPVFYLENPALERGLSGDGLSWALTSFRAANWFPTTRLSMLLDAEWHGASAAGVHRTNVGLHAASSLLLFLALLRMTRRPGASAFVAAVFALHPLQVESVAWASERKGVLAGFFWMAVLLVYAGVGRGALSLARGAAVLALLALGLGAKLTLATLPFVLLLLDHWPLARLTRGDGSGVLDAHLVRRAVLEKLPLLAAVLVATLCVFEAQSRGGAVASFEQVPWGARLGNAAVAYLRYVGLFFWPRDLAVLHPHPGTSLPVAQVAGALALLAAATGLALWRLREWPAVAVGWLWFAGTLVPMIGFVHLGSQALAERYAYVPSIGLALAVAWGVPAAFSRVPRARRTLPVAALAVLAALGVASHRQAQVWRDSETLFRHALRVTERNHVAAVQLGHALLEQGRTEEAVASYRQALEIHPADTRTSNNLAWLLATHPDAALRDGAAATSLARETVRRTAGRDPAALDTLAAAYAADDRYDLAALTAAKAERLARTTDPELAAAIGARLER